MKITIPSVPIALTILFFGLLPKAQAVSPAPDGGYPGGNTATGTLALYSNSGIENTANGYGALASNSTGGENTADGYAALINNTTGTENTANGVFALNHNTDGSGNTAIGWDALLNNTTGFENTALGEAAGSAVITAGHVLCLDHSGGDVSN